MKRPLLIAALLVAAAPLIAPQIALGAALAGPERSFEVAQAAPQGQVPLSRVLKMLATQHPGKQINTTMGETAGRPAYLVQWLLINGRMAVFTVDAQTGRVVGQQGG
jgi:uncharacterized membrane protein YkoI